MSNWQNQVVLITGASSGLGRHLAGAFARVGCRVILVARGAEALESAAEELRAAGGQATPLPCDLTSDADVERLVERVRGEFGRLDVLVNNAGRSARGALRDTPVSQFEELIELNLLAVVRLTRAALPLLLAARGQVVNIGSLAAKSAGRWLGAYPASKFALAAYTQQLRLELADEGLHVLLVCPGPIARTESSQRPRYETAGLPSEAARPGGGVKTKALDPDRLAGEILTACQRRDPELIRPRKARLLFVLSQWSPRLGDWLIRRMT